MFRCTLFFVDDTCLAVVVIHILFTDSIRTVRRTIALSILHPHTPVISTTQILCLLLSRSLYLLLYCVALFYNYEPPIRVFALVTL
jgi:hypothetical protein